MLTLEDCIALCDLSEEEVRAIAEHEHIPEIAAAEMASYLMHCPDGEQCIKTMIRDDIANAIASGNRVRELTLKAVLRNFILQHPRCEERHRQMLGVPERRAGDAAARLSA
jgi:hypothetical protein